VSPTFRKDLFLHLQIGRQLKLEAAVSSRRYVNFYYFQRRYILEDGYTLFVIISRILCFVDLCNCVKKNQLDAQLILSIFR